MSDTSGLQNADAEGVPAEDRPDRFESGANTSDANNGGASNSGADDSGDAQGVSAPDETGVTPDGAQDVTPEADRGGEGAEPPPAEFDPAQQPSNPDLVKNTEPPD